MRAIDPAGPPSAAAGAPTATVKRRLLAVYVDYLIFSAVWTVAVFPLAGLFNQPWTRFAAFALLEGLLLPMNASIGHRILSIRKSDSGYVVDPDVKANESWLTMITAVLLLLDGSKMAARWTAGAPAIPLWGMRISESMQPIQNAFLGIGYMAAAYLMFKLRRDGWYFCLGLCAALLASAIVSWPLWGDYVTEYLAIRSAILGRPADPTLDAFLGWIFPVAHLASLVIVTIVLILRRKRFTT